MYFQKKIPNPEQLEIFTLKSFTGGLNNTGYVLKDNELSDVVNLAFSGDDVLEKRFGTELHGETTYPEPLVFIDHYEPYTDQRIEMSATKHSIYANGVVIGNSHGNVTGVNFGGKFILTDENRLRVYGKFPQEESTYVSLNGEAVDEYRLMTVVDAPKGYEPLDKEHTEGKTHYDYENNQIWYEPCQFEVEDPYNGASVVPKNPKYLVAHNGRLYVSGDKEDDDNVFLSGVQNPFYFPVALPLQPTPNADRVVGLVVYNDSVIVGRHYDIYAITGSTNNFELSDDVFALRKLNTHTGFANHNGVNVVHNFLFYLGYDGICYKMSSINQSDHLLLTTVISKQLDLTKKPLSFTREEIEKACSYFYKDEWYVSIGEKVLVYSYRNQSWTLYTGLDARCFTLDEYELIWGNSKGQVIQFSKDKYLDLGVPYLATFKTKNFDMGNPALFKHFREFGLIAHVYEEVGSDIRLTFEIDYQSITVQNVIKNQMSRWGISEWGDQFIGRNINFSRPIYVGRRGRYICFSLSNGWDVQERVHSVGHLEEVREKKNNESLCYVELEKAYYLYKNYEWVRMEEEDLNQSMCIYEINGDYGLRGKR